MINTSNDNQRQTTA